MLCFPPAFFFFFLLLAWFWPSFFSQGGRSLRQWTKRGCSRYIHVFLGCFFFPFHGLFYLHFLFIFLSAGKHGGRKIKQNGTWSSLTCIFSFLFSFSSRLFFSFVLSGFQWLAGIHIVTVCFVSCVGVGCVVHIACGRKVSAIVVIVLLEIVSLFVFLSYCTVLFYHSVLLAS